MRAQAAIDGELAGAWRLYHEGKAQTARAGLERLLATPAADARTRSRLLRAMLEICVRNGDGDCVAAHAPAFMAAAQTLAANDNAEGRALLALEAAYFYDYARWVSGVDPRQILAGQAWKHEIAADGELYLKRQVLASNLFLEVGDQPGLDRSLNKILSLIAALKNPREGRATVAASLSDAIATLLAAGETERAWGLYRASGADIAQALPPLSRDMAIYALTVGKLNQQVGEVAAARKALELSASILRRIELPAELRRDLLAEALSLRAALAVADGDAAAARAALAEHPFAGLYAAPGRAPASAAEVGYLVVRLLASSAAAAPDPVAAAALQKPLAFQADPETQEIAAGFRAAGVALAAPVGAERQRRLAELARTIQAVARRQDAAGRLSRIDTVDRVLLGLALGAGEAGRGPADADAAFTLFQLANRTGATFDADALAALAQAKDELQRRTLHQALRLRARRDRLERERIQTVTAGLAGPVAGDLLRHDIAQRQLLRDYSERLADAERRLAKDGLSVRGPRLVRLAELQAALKPDEAALAVAPTFGGLAYFCVRRDRTLQRTALADARQMKLDIKLLQASLTAGHAPSDALDAQFPAAAAVRLYDALIRPFEPCLKPGDRIVWLSGVAFVGLPLAALLPAPPPKAGQGYDLAGADWLVRRHAVAYAGSAGVIVARRIGARAAADFDFLGVGDPVLEKAGPALTRGVRAGGRFEGLAPLPETRRELEASARGFGATRLLLGEAATERQVRGQVLGDYRYLSFATHGLLRDDLQGLSEPALVLTPASAEAGDDGLLTASEIADMNLRASFVALSACNTANFELDAMVQDLPALASAFAVSGVPATLGTLWPVDSATGEAVVSGLFARLRDGGAAPADALAQAQRAFLAAPPGRAFLHPRFWAPFAVLGDGTAARPAPPAVPIRVRSVEIVEKGTEVLALASTPAGVAAWFAAEPAPGVGLGEGIRLGLGDEAWRRIDHDAAPSRLLGRTGPQLVAGGYARLADGRIAPRLQAYDEAGRLTASWRGDTLSGLDAGFLAAAAEGPASMLAVVGERKRPDDPRLPGVRLRIFRIGADLAPSLLFEVEAPPGARIANATITPLGERILLTYTAINGRREPEPGGFDTYDIVGCALNSLTWMELRDSSGKILKSDVRPDFAAVSAAVRADGEVLLGGFERQGCAGERQAMVLAVDRELAARVLYRDDSLGASEVRALALLSGGRTLVAAHKQSLTDFAPVGENAAIFHGLVYSTLLLTIDGQGRRSAPKLIDAGSNVLPTAVLAQPDGEVLVGGSLGDRAAIFRLSAP